MKDVPSHDGKADEAALEAPPPAGRSRLDYASYGTNNAGLSQAERDALARAIEQAKRLPGTPT